MPFVNKDTHYELYSVQLKGKAPTQLLIEWPGENNGHTLSIYGEASAIDELWVPNNDVFDYEALKNRGKQIQPPLFSKGNWKKWWEDTWGWEDTWDLRWIKRNFIIEKNGTITNITCDYRFEDSTVYKKKKFIL